MGRHYVFVYADKPHEWNCSQWRVVEPAKALGRLNGISVTVISAEEFADLGNLALRNEIGKADLIHIQRNIVDLGVLNAWKYWNGVGKATTLDLDDAYTILPPTNAAFDFWVRNPQGLDPPPLELVKKCLPHFDAFTSPSKRILDDWKHHWKRALWWPNWVTGSWYEGVTKGTHEGIVIGWGGSSSHYDTFWFTPAKEALKRVCELRPQVKVRICGFDKRLYDMLPVPESQKEHVPFVSPDQWPKNLAQFDIGIAPLAEEFDQRRSWIKAMEYMMCKVPWVASQGSPYEELAQYGNLVPDDVDAWTKALIDLIDTPKDTEPAYLAGLDLTLERRAPDLAGMLEKIVQAKEFETGRIRLANTVNV
jgi:glycosyltransferase involved in cell wall biosynthesis